MHGTLSKNFNAQNQLSADFEPIGERTFNVCYKNYSRLPKINLPKDFLELSNLKIALEKRHSTRTYDANKTLDLKELSTILFYSAGINNNQGKDFDPNRRFYPSGGSRYPLEIYLGIYRVSEIKPGIYHYNVKNHQLEILTEDSKDLEQLKQALYLEWSREAAVFLFITSVWDRNFTRYADRGYKIVLMEAGHLAQNIALTAAALNIGCVNLLGFTKKTVDEVLSLESKVEDAIYLAVLGHEKLD